MSKQRDDLISQAEVYKRNGESLPLDLYSDLMEAGIDPNALMSDNDQDQSADSRDEEALQTMEEMESRGMHEVRPDQI